MADLMFVVLTVAFFAFTAAYIVRCERIEGRRGD
jgi:hypothetical protein